MHTRVHYAASRLTQTWFWVALGMVVTGLWLMLPRVWAQTTPTTVTYEGVLLDSSGAALTTAHNVRVSVWKSADFDSGDVTGAGAINTGATNYGGWFEVHAVTPDANGIFSVQLGSITPLPTTNFDNIKYFQVEVKAAADADTGYELLDVNTSSATIDRQTIGSTFFTQNAETLDNYSVGTEENNLAILGSGGRWATSQIPDGTDQSVFSINAAASKLTLSSASLTADRTFLFPDKSGTVALLSDIVTGTYVGTSTGTYTGTITSDALVSYQAANAICNADHTGSHLCSTDEILATIASQDISGNTGNMWIAEGPPGFTASANDCNAWTANDADSLGPFWNWDANAGGGRGFLTPCTSSLKLACCR